MEENQEIANREVQVVTSPLQKTVWQADILGFLLYPVIAHELALQPGSFNIPFGALEVEPLPAPAGMVNRANDNWTAWALVEDHRRDKLFYQSAPAAGEAPARYAPYDINTAVQIDGAVQSYDGGGPLPPWLLTEPPPSSRGEVGADSLSS